VRSVDEAEDVNAEADKDAEADERTFAPDVEAIAKGGLAKALPEVDARLRLAMRGESAGAQSDTDADALTAKRAASTAEDQAVDIVACLKQCGDLRGYGGARLVPRRDYALSELKLNGIEAEKLLSPTESTISGLRDLISRAMVVLVGGWVFAAHPSGSQVTGLLVTGAGALAIDQVAFAGGTGGVGAGHLGAGDEFIVQVTVAAARGGALSGGVPHGHFTERVHSVFD
jgi:hypothetical protein